MRRPILLACLPAGVACLLACCFVGVSELAIWVCGGGAVVEAFRVRRICESEGVWDRRAARLNESCGEWGRQRRTKGGGGRRACALAGGTPGSQDACLAAYGNNPLLIGVCY